MSEDSFISPKKMKGHKGRNNNKKDMRIFETCCTEEFAYISSFGVDNNSNCSFMSPCSMDTVIEKESGFKLSEKLEKMQSKGKTNGKPVPLPTSNNRNVARNNCRPTKLNNIKKIADANQKNKSDNVCGDSSFVICLDNKDDKKKTESNTYHQGYENNITENDYVPDTAHTSQYGKLSYSCTSGPGLVKVNKHTNKNDKRDNNKSLIFHLEKSNQAINGITKVVVCKGQNVVPTNRSKSPKRKPFQETLNNQQKLTITEIRRRLSKQKFPIVILGKDQLSSTIEVIEEEPPQFNGLSEKVWPFMLKWYGKEPRDTHDAFKTKYSEINGHTKRSKHVDVAKNVESRIKNGPKNFRFKDKTCDNELKCNKNKTGRTVPAKLLEILDQPQQRVKSKPIRQFRDKMIKLLYKNSTSVPSVIDGSPNSESAKNLNNIYNNKASKVDICTDTGFDIDEKNSIKISASSTKPKIFSSADKRPWAKAKWASDFIDNVIRKIKTGAYYTHDSKVIKQSSDYESKEVEVQTDSTCDIHDEKSITIPGFDNLQPAVEIQAMNMNEISVKHCVTNIMVHFDVTDPTKPILNFKDASSLVPINVDESHTKIFKCKTSILNAMLPAELCSLLPKMLRKIAESRDQLPNILIPIDKSSCLSTISEVSQSETPKDSIRNYILQIAMSKELRKLVNGTFRNTDNMYQKLHIVRNSSLLIKYERQLGLELKLDIKIDPLLNYNNIIYNPIKSLKLNTQENIVTPSDKCSEHINTCTALQPYPLSERRIIPSFKPFDLTCLFKDMISFVNYNGASYISIKNSNYDNFINISMNTRDHINVQNILTIGVGDFNMDFPFNGFSNGFATNNKITFFPNSTNGTFKESTKCIDYVETFESSSNSNEKDTLQTDVSVNNNKVRRKGYVKLYKKCKSNSNLYGEKATPLSKITHLDDFFQALGSGKLLSTVFDSQSGQKILSSVQEMKNWTSEINPRQALLVLLLINKKDTTNLVRYRQVLLQGIAVNRITKSDELDMEIEVIERENLNKLSQHEGISYLPASIENQDNLFEELCWIAKTTASDYQRPFDESSEKLLKSLLEKRKKLNPSYLRVMARYVGLGLLKSPGKK